MCYRFRPEYLCRCWCQPKWFFCDSSHAANIYAGRPCPTNTAARYLADLTAIAYIEELGFCCSEACCEEMVQARRSRYAALGAEDEELVRGMENVGPAEMARQAERLEEARGVVEAAEVRHGGCGEARASYLEDPMDVPGRW
ncbi:hypothetical protein LTR36_005178 [Oleoguttula mirabilis]|uniref:Uncharacterized protein n=1 Tax=Oleoguttula mirabilis TaxID=1507867 RepID=A0AAV9JWH1_9PEZI|nr:hypothetical protein LTR36_005178 [Oleoguttula mirabilis]